MKKVLFSCLGIVIIAVILIYVFTKNETPVNGKDYLYDKVEEYIISKEKPHYFIENKYDEPNYEISDFKVFTDIARLGIREKGDENYVYVWALVESYYVQDDKLVTSSGWSIPCKYIIKDDEVIECIQPLDGSYYAKSLRKIFPLDIREKLDDSLVDTEKLRKEVDEYYSYLKDEKIEYKN